MFTKTVDAKVVGIRTYTGKTSEGKEYKIKYYNLVYATSDNNVEGYQVESIKSNLGLSAGDYKLLICTIKQGDKYYKEILSAEKLTDKEKKE